MANVFYTKEDLIGAYIVLDKLKREVIDELEDSGTFNVKGYLQVTFDMEMKKIDNVLNERDRAILTYNLMKGRLNE